MGTWASDHIGRIDNHKKSDRHAAYRIAALVFAALGLIGLILAFGNLGSEHGAAAASAHRDLGLVSLAGMFAGGGWLTRLMWRDTGARLGLDGKARRRR
ncbi:MAG: hypothetical protein AB7O39_10935 [Flavobacteriaceae bacterium]